MTRKIMVPGGAVVAAAFICMVALVLPGCEAVFTYSPFTFLQRDPEKMTSEQKISWAEDALESDDTEQVKSAYDVIMDLVADTEPGDDKTGLQVLASDLSLKASGVTDAVLDILGGLVASPDIGTEDPEGLTDSLQGALDQVDPEYAQNYLELVDSLPDEAVTYDKYLYAAAAVIMSDSAVIENLDTYDPDDPDPEIEDSIDRALGYLTKCRDALPTDGSVPDDVMGFFDQFGSFLGEDA